MTQPQPALNWLYLGIARQLKSRTITSTLLRKAIQTYEIINPARPLGPKDFFSGVDYHTHNLEGPKPEYMVISLRPSPAGRTVKDQPFCLVPRHNIDPRVRVDISSGYFSINASQLLDHEDLTGKTAAAISSALSIAKYVHNQPEISDESKAGLHHLKLDLVSLFNFSCKMTC